jgi:hypothetical protein
VNVDWTKLQPKDDVTDEYGGITDPEDAPLGTIICLVGTYGVDGRYYYDPNQEMQGEHFSRGIDSQGIMWKNV